MTIPRTTPRLYPDLLGLVIDQSWFDIKTLANLCLVSRSFVNRAQKALYYELDLVNAPGYESSASSIGQLTEAARQKRRETMEREPHLLAKVGALAISLERSEEQGGLVEGSNTRFQELLDTLPDSSNIDHVHVLFGQRELPSQGYFVIAERVRSKLEAIISSPRMRSIDIEIYAIYDRACPFPGWIFRSLSYTTKTVKLMLATQTRISVIPGAVYPNAPPILNQVRKRFLVDFDFAVRRGGDSMERCAVILSGLCFNFKFSGLKRLTVTHMPEDKTLWTLPQDAAETLEHLTIRAYPNRHAFLWSIQKDHFSPYQRLRTITLGVFFFHHLFIHNSSESLTDLFSVPLPPLLERITLHINLGRFLMGSLPDTFEPGAGANLESWRLTDEVISRLGSISTLAVKLEWSSKRIIEQLHEPDEIAWEQGVERLCANWRDIFRLSDEQGKLTLSYTHTIS
ncbi:hypothetical protein D9611_005397 [Ephemerocybe angulata]|uniref:Uncharacterized protein n=1 Tax=Ephemerocybe angulata TaxID=980116 RepID=A0A8H5C2B4_9AGAR|nr:hypothetical protein D9611_005397 [Tulosesus angulatus]